MLRKVYFLVFLFLIYLTCKGKVGTTLRLLFLAFLQAHVK